MKSDKSRKMKCNRLLDLPIFILDWGKMFLDRSCIQCSSILKKKTMSKLKSITHFSLKTTKIGPAPLDKHSDILNGIDQPNPLSKKWVPEEN